MIISSATVPLFHHIYATDHVYFVYTKQALTAVSVSQQCQILCPLTRCFSKSSVLLHEHVVTVVRSDIILVENLTLYLLREGRKSAPLLILQSWQKLHVNVVRRKLKKWKYFVSRPEKRNYSNGTIWEVRSVNVVLVVIGALGSVTKRFEKWFDVNSHVVQKNLPCWEQCKS